MLESPNKKSFEPVTITHPILRVYLILFSLIQSIFLNGKSCLAQQCAYYLYSKRKYSSEMRLKGQ